MQEAMLWHKERNGVSCDLCAANCFVSKGKFGLCQVRKNEENKLFTTTFGQVVGTEVTFVERRHAFHFLPQSKTLAVKGIGCNFNDQFCIDEYTCDKEAKTEDMLPEDVVELAEDKGCKSISYGFTDTTLIFEFAYRIAKAAHRSNVKNLFVTNGYISDEAIKKVAKYLDGMVVNFKASGDPDFMKKYCLIPNTKSIFRSLKQMKKHRVFVEITNTIIPQIGDSVENCKKLAEWINSELGSEIPFHLVQFMPDKKFPGIPPTPVQTLQKCLDESKQSGLRYVYIDNVPKNPNQNTYCYNCRELLIQRDNQSVKKSNLTNDRCPTCGLRINLVIK